MQRAVRMEDSRGRGGGWLCDALHCAGHCVRAFRATAFTTLVLETSRWRLYGSSAAGEPPAWCCLVTVALGDDVMGGREEEGCPRAGDVVGAVLEHSQSSTGSWVCVPLGLGLDQAGHALSPHSLLSLMEETSPFLSPVLILSRPLILVKTNKTPKTSICLVVCRQLRGKSSQVGVPVPDGDGGA